MFNSFIVFFGLLYPSTFLYFHYINFWEFDIKTPGTNLQFCSFQSLGHVQLFLTPWTAAYQASLSITNSRSPPKLMSIESVKPSNHLILCCPLLLLPSIFPSIRVFSSEPVLHIRGPSVGVSASTSFFSMNIQDWFPLGWTSRISLQSKGMLSKGNVC